MSWFITFEGPEGAGKTTQCHLLAERLQAEGYRCLVTREPGGTPLGEAVRAWLLQGDSVQPVTEALLFTAARAEHVRQRIEPALRQGIIVICDRYVDSTLAYQGAGRGLDEAWLRSLHRVATGDLWPHRTFLLDVPVELGLARRRSAGQPLTRLDSELLAFHQRVRTWYHAAAQREPERWRLIDATARPDVVAAQIWVAVAELLQRGDRAG